VSHAAWQALYATNKLKGISYENWAMQFIVIYCYVAFYCYVTDL